MNEQVELAPEFYLTKTEVFVLNCRRRGMSDTAIRRLLHLSAAEAVALGLMTTQGTKSPAVPEQSTQPESSNSWPQREGRRKPFARRSGRHHMTRSVRLRSRERQQGSATDYNLKTKDRGDKV